jgi:hypothetical protein
MKDNLSSVRTSDTMPQTEATDTDALTAGGFAASTDSVEISQSANGIGPRWDTFQNRLRERRKEVINTGRTEAETGEYRKAS